MLKKAMFMAGMLTALVAQLSFPQTQVDLRTQTKSVDFSGASSTRPLKTGAANKTARYPRLPRALRHARASDLLDAERGVT